ncbi:MAG: S9 family peptidase [Deltaproteobacteria bacterium]|nr:S9 family peptidase [Deltaproteobacteria bacterium]
MEKETRRQIGRFQGLNIVKAPAQDRFRTLILVVLVLFISTLPLNSYGLSGSSLKNPTRTPGQEIGKTQRISIDDLLYMESLTWQAISPDGSNVAWIKSGYRPGADIPSCNLFMTRLGDLSTKQLTKYDGKSIVKAQWSPDGKALAFMGNIPAEDGQPLTQVWKVDIQSGKLKQLTKAPNGVSDFAWSGAGTILYTAADIEANNKSDHKDDTIHVTEYIETPVRLFRLHLVSGRTERLTDNNDMIVSISVSPNGRYAFLVRTRAKSPMYYQDIPYLHYILDLDRGRERQIFLDMRISDSASWSRDSLTLFATELFVKDEYMFAFLRVLRTFDVISGQEKVVDLGWDRGLLYASKIIPTSDGFLALLEDGCHPKLARYVKSAHGYERRMMQAEHQGNIFSMDANADGKTICYEHSTSSKPTQYYFASIDGDAVEPPRQYTKLNPQFEGKVFARAEAITWQGALGDIVEGMLYFPANYDPKKKYPLILRIHGGPVDCVRDRWALLGWLFPYHILSQKGAFVLDPNYHGSLGYGIEFSRSIRDGKMYEYPLEDIEKGIARLVELGMVDETRLGTMGWSQGSVLSNALIARDQRFKAASCGAGGAEWVSYWGLSYAGHSFCEYYLGGSPVEKPGLFKEARLAPFYDAAKVKTPVIMFTCERDVNVPPAQVWITYRGIQKYGSAPVELYVFPGEPHILQRLSHQRRKMMEEQKWFDKYLFKGLE